MRISTMRRVDQWLGVPVCLTLTATRRVLSLFGSPPNDAPGRIIFVKLAEMGSTVLAYSTIRRAADMVGRENVYFVAFEENRFILDVMELIPEENVIAIQTNGLGRVVMGSLRAIREMRRLRIDTAIDLEFFARSSAILSYLSGAKRRVGFHAFGGDGPYRGDLMTHRLIYNPHLHTAETFRTMVEALNVPPEQLPTFGLKSMQIDEPPPLNPPPEEVEQARSLLRQASGVDDYSPLVLLNANCSDLLPLRRWPSERYIELARRLIERYPRMRVAMTGAPDEADAVKKLIEQVGSDRCFNLAGRTTLRQLMVVYTLADVLVTNDSGPAHFATLTPIDVVTLFGPEHPKLFAARSPRNHAIWAGIPCSPCVSALNNRVSPCTNNLCMQRIQVDQVFDQVCQRVDARMETQKV